MLLTVRFVAFWFFLIGALILFVVNLFHGNFIAAVTGPVLFVCIGLFIMSPRGMIAAWRAPAFISKKSDGI